MMLRSRRPSSHPALVKTSARRHPLSTPNSPNKTFLSSSRDAVTKDTLLRGKMAKKFIVNAAQAPTSSLSFPPKSLAVVVLPSLVAVVVVTQYLEDHKLLLLLTAVSMAFVMILIGILLLWGDKSEGLEVSLSVNQLSVQVSTSRRGKIIGYPVLIDRKDILDIVVNEVILSHKVVSVVVLRILLNSTETAARPQEEKAQQLPMQTLLKEGNVKLQVAFPGVEMSYMECVTMRREICKALDL